jgi:3-keto-disaccharide hydrolase
VNKQPARIAALIILVSLVGSMERTFADSSPFELYGISINGKYDNCSTFNSGYPLLISTKINTSGPSLSVIGVIRIFDSGGQISFSDSIKILLNPNGRQLLSFKLHLNSTGSHTATIFVVDGSNESEILSNVEKLQFNLVDYSNRVDARFLYDDFSEGTYNLDNYEISPNGKWYGWFSGSKVQPGQQGVRASTTTPGNVFFSESPSPERQTMHQRTYSSLTLSTESYKNFQLNLDVRTVSQGRTSSNPNPWEVAWIFWHVVGRGTDPLDRTHFYYFLVKATGVEVGKYDGGTNPESQIILIDTPYPAQTSIKNNIGEWQNWNISVINDHIIIKVNNETAFDFMDNATFDMGRIGLYNEDSKTEFGNIRILNLC